MAKKPQTLGSRSALPQRDMNPKHSTARSLLKFAGTWLGDDLEERLSEVRAWRGRACFDYLRSRHKPL
jgi:hypothetical protein